MASTATSVRSTSTNAPPILVRMEQLAMTTSIPTPATAAVVFLAQTVRSTTKIAHRPPVSMGVRASTASTTTLAFVPMASPDPIASCRDLSAGTKIPVKMEEPAAIRLLSMAISPVTANRVGRATIVSNWWIGVGSPPVKTEPGAHKEELLTSATA